MDETGESLKQWEKDQWDEVRRLCGENNEFMWTMIEGDSGKWYISPGCHIVNRVYTIICRKPRNIDSQRQYFYC